MLTSHRQRDEVVEFRRISVDSVDTRYKIGRFGDVLPRQSLGVVWKNYT